MRNPNGRIIRAEHVGLLPQDGAVERVGDRVVAAVCVHASTLVQALADGVVDRSVQRHSHLVGLLVVVERLVNIAGQIANVAEQVQDPRHLRRLWDGRSRAP